jgi:dihydroorotase
MTEIFDLIIRGATCVTPAGVGDADIAVRNGKIAVVGDLSGAEAATVIEATGLHVLPGVIDTQVHFREPGNEHKEDLASGSRAAVLGGVTGVFEMPNTKPPTTTVEAFTDKIQRATGRMWCDFAFYVGASAENVRNLGWLERLRGCCGVKVFMGSSTGSLLVADDETLTAVLQNGRRRVAIHAEDEARLEERKGLRRPGDPSSHVDWRDEETALFATRRLLELARNLGRRVHVLHITTGAEMALLAEYKDVATVEVTPQHLTLASPDCYAILGTRAQMNPPIRDAAQRELLWSGVAGGVVDVIGSDHAPHTKEEKAKPYPESPAGLPGVQTLVPIMLDHVAAGRLTLQRFVDLTSAGAVRIFGIAGKGRIAVGFDADFTLVDLKEKREVTDEQMASTCGWTPFAGMTLTGWPLATVIAGKVVMQDGELIGEPSGKPMRFVESLHA